MEKIYIPRGSREKNMQRALIQYGDPDNHKLVLQALKEVDRLDLVGFGVECLIKPRVLKKNKVKDAGNKNHSNRIRAKS
jgi:arylamine N-acetyltransferase